MNELGTHQVNILSSWWYYDHVSGLMLMRIRSIPSLVNWCTFVTAR